MAFFEVFGQFLLRLRWVFQLLAVFSMFPAHFGGFRMVFGSESRVEGLLAVPPGALRRARQPAAALQGVISCLEMSFSRIQLPEARRTYILALLTMKIQYQQERNT